LRNTGAVRAFFHKINHLRCPYGACHIRKMMNHSREEIIRLTATVACAG